jgi:hypothetical protein
MASKLRCPGLDPHRQGAKANEGGTYRQLKATDVDPDSEAEKKKIYSTSRICPKRAVSSEVLPANPSILTCLRGGQETRSAPKDMEKFYDTINTQAVRPRPRPSRQAWEIMQRKPPRTQNSKSQGQQSREYNGDPNFYDIQMR